MPHHRTIAPRPDAERGAALFIVIVALISASALSLGLLTVALGRSQAIQKAKGMDMALAMAEAGLDRAVIVANENMGSTTWPATASPWTTLPDSVFDYEGAELGAFSVEILPGHKDGFDNDGDGSTDEADEEEWIVMTSTGEYPASSPQFRAVVEAQYSKYVNTPNIQSAVFIADSSITLDISKSAAYKVSGYDHDMYAGSKLAVPGLPGIAGEASSISVSPPNTMANVISSGNVEGDDGSGGSQPMATNMTPMDPPIADILDWATSTFEYQTINSSGKTSTAGAIQGTNAEAGPPKVEPVFKTQYFKGDFKFTGNASGAGILVFDGDVEFGGTIKFTGIIIVNGTASFSGGGSGSQLTGALITAESVTENFSAGGTIDILYSNEAVTKAANAAAVWQMDYWIRRPAAQP